MELSNALINLLANPGANKSALGLGLAAIQPNPPIDLVSATTLPIAVSDSGRVKSINTTTGCVVTLPKTAAVGFFVSLLQEGSGRITIAVESGATFKHIDDLTKSRATGSVITALCLANDGGSAARYLISGDMSA